VPLVPLVSVVNVLFVSQCATLSRAGERPPNPHITDVIAGIRDIEGASLQDGFVQDQTTMINTEIKKTPKDREMISHNTKMLLTACPPARLTD
jgi:hypothetical protein